MMMSMSYSLQSDDELVRLSSPEDQAGRAIGEHEQTVDLVDDDSGHLVPVSHQETLDGFPLGDVCRLLHRDHDLAIHLDAVLRCRQRQQHRFRRFLGGGVESISVGCVSVDQRHTCRRRRKQRQRCERHQGVSPWREIRQFHWTILLLLNLSFKKLSLTILLKTDFYNKKHIVFKRCVFYCLTHGKPNSVTGALFENYL